MRQTVVEKIAQSHLAAGSLERPLRCGDDVLLRPRHVMTHDNTAPVMALFRSFGATRVRDPRQPVFVLDHDIQNRSEKNLAKYAAIEAFARAQGIDFYPAGTGIGHQVMIEEQYAVPGALVVASDSHANMYGGIGALGTPVVRTDAAAVWATGTFWWRVPRTVEVSLVGRLAPGVTGKDVILTLCGLVHEADVLNAVVEFSGEGVAGLSIDERLTLANMTTEWGALAGWFPVDARTLSFARETRERLLRRGIRRIGEQEIVQWGGSPPAPDADAEYSARIELDLASVSPRIAGPDAVHVTAALAEIEARRIAIHKAYLVSCVNSRVSDIAEAARVLRGGRVAPRVELYVSAASREVQRQAEDTGDWHALLAAGARPLPPGCGPCIGLGAGLLQAGEIGISATNRNFKGRMGSRDAHCYLASPAVVAASARAGYICGPVPSAVTTRPVVRVERRSPTTPATPAGVERLPGFPSRIDGRFVWLAREAIDTDGIYGKEHVFRDDLPAEVMARVVFENYEPGLAGRLQRGDVLVAGERFGTGSSREQAVTALQAAGIAALVAASFSWTYLRNAFNNGFICLICPALVEHLHSRFAREAGTDARSWIPGEGLTLDFSTACAIVDGRAFPFPALSAATQTLVIDGGLARQVRASLGGPGETA